MDTKLKNTIEFIINNDLSQEKYIKKEENIEDKFYTVLDNYYTNNNIYKNNRFKKNVPRWHIDKFLKIEKNIILKKYIFTKN